MKNNFNYSTISFRITLRRIVSSEFNDRLLLISGSAKDCANDLSIGRFRQDGNLDSTFGNQGLVILNSGKLKV